MFTGIIEKTGIIERLSKEKDFYTLAVRTAKFHEPVKNGDSIAINGACLTITRRERDTLFFNITEKTFRGTTFSRAKKNDVVNIERSLRLESRVEGHFVLGHVDGTRQIANINKGSRPHVEIKLFTDDKISVVEKGSIAIDGISLTIADIADRALRAYIIPYTMQNTNLKARKNGDHVNVEFDILGKYATARSGKTKTAMTAVTEELLKSKGFALRLRSG